MDTLDYLIEAMNKAYENWNKTNFNKTNKEHEIYKSLVDYVYAHYEVWAIDEAGERYHERIRKGAIFI